MVEEILEISTEEKSKLPQTQPENTFVPKVHKKAKGPNPLSVKRKRPLQQPLSTKSQESLSLGQKRKRDDMEGPEEDGTATSKKKRRRKKKSGDPPIVPEGSAIPA